MRRIRLTNCRKAKRELELCPIATRTPSKVVLIKRSGEQPDGSSARSENKAGGKKLSRLNPQARFRWKAGIAILLLLLATACREKKRVAQASRALASQLTAASGKPSDPPKVVDIEEQRVYLDASLSMQGFVNDQRHSAFDDFIEQIGDVLPGCRLYKYGQRGSAPPASIADLVTLSTFGTELHRRDFYNLSYNPDDQLISVLARENRAVLSVLISDGVYSEPRGSTTPPVVEAIRSWIGDGRVLGILALKSSFSGPFYSERLRTMLPSISVPSRPFYAFVFSPTEQGFRELQAKLQRRFPAMRSILFTDDSVSCSVELSENLRSVYSFEKPPTSPYYWQMFDDSLFAQKVPAEIGYRLKYVVSPEYPAGEFKTDVTSECYRWDKAEFKKMDQPPLGFSLQLQPKSPIEAPSPEAGKPAKPVITPPDFAIYVPKDSTSDYEFYHLKLASSPKSLRREIQDLSTRDDSLRENANKTFRFFELITALTDVHFKSRLARKVSPQIFATVANH